MPIEKGNRFIKIEESRETPFEGSIVDIETIGDFRKVGSRALPLGSDYLQRYQLMEITTVGILSNGKLSVYVANGQNNLDAFQQTATRKMREATSPLFAFNKAFEEACYYWNSEHKLFNIDYELQKEPFEKKENVVRMLGIDNYDDPFYGEGFKCVGAFRSNDLQSIAAHNRACLLKETQILSKRGAEKIVTRWLDHQEK